MLSSYLSISPTTAGGHTIQPPVWHISVYKQDSQASLLIMIADLSTNEDHERSPSLPLLSVLGSAWFLRPCSCSPAASRHCSARWNQASALESFTPTMLANENDGGGEENGNETFQKKVPRVCLKVQKHGGALHRQKFNDFCNNCRSCYPGMGVSWHTTACNVEGALGKNEKNMNPVLLLATSACTQAVGEEHKAGEPQTCVSNHKLFSFDHNLCCLCSSCASTGSLPPARSSRGDLSPPTYWFWEQYLTAPWGAAAKHLQLSYLPLGASLANA